MSVAVSIIVPIYHGKQYIKQIIEQIEVCSENTDTEVELLLVNDDPTMPIETDLFSERIAIRVFNTERNRGIHGSRVKGLQAAEGKFILFLDQDDRIFPSYLKSQLGGIGEADAIVCRLIDGNRIYYDEQSPFENAVDKKHVIGKGNTIVSPGQVLLRSSALPDIWKKHILHNNGADDWMLWICMLSEGKRFALNDAILFEHVMEESNTSLHTVKMIQSQQEVVEVIRTSNLLSREEMEMLQQALQSEIYGKLQLLDKFRKMTTLYDEWLCLENKGIRFSDILKNRGYHTCAIYGNGIIGKRIYEVLKHTDIRVCYFIDRSLPYYKESIPVYQPDDELPDVDITIISLIEDGEDVRKLLDRNKHTEIWTITELLQEAHS